MDKTTQHKLCMHCSSGSEQVPHLLDDFFVGKHDKVTEYCKLQFSYCSSCKCFRNKSSFENAKKTCHFCSSRKRRQHETIPHNREHINNIDNFATGTSRDRFVPEIKIKYNPFILGEVTKIKFYEDPKSPQEVRTICNCIQLCYQIHLHEKGQISISRFTFKGNLENDCALGMALEFLVKCTQCILKFKLQKLQTQNYLTKVNQTQATLIYSLVQYGRVRKEQIIVRKGDIQGRDFEPLSLLCPGWIPPHKLDNNVLKVKKSTSTLQGCTSFREFFLESSACLAWTGSLQLLVEWMNQLSDNMVPSYLPSFQITLTDLDSYTPRPKLCYWIKNDREGAPYELYYGNKSNSSRDNFLQQFPTLPPCLMRLSQHASEIISSYMKILAQQ